MGQTPVNSARAGRMRGPLIVALIVAGVLAWNIFAWRIIGNRPRTWQYGSARAIPAESYASSQPAPAAAQPPKQVELPATAAPGGGK